MKLNPEFLKELKLGHEIWCSIQKPESKVLSLEQWVTALLYPTVSQLIGQKRVMETNGTKTKT